MPLLIYNLILLLLSPLIVLYLLFRLSKGKEDRERWGERWGRYGEDVSRDTRTPRFWVHAVSVGEVMAAIPVLRELRQRYPEAFILLSTTTIGGREVAQKQKPPADAVVYYPLDTPFAVRDALAAARPDVVILMEWEIWSNFLTAAKRQGAKIAVLNGRISDKGLRRGQRGQVFTRPGLNSVDLFAMQSAEDSRRATLVGADPAKVQTFGNTKFDESLTPLSQAERAVLRADLGIPEGVPVWICGSTRDDTDSAAPDEETLVAAAANRVRERFPNLFLIVAPRHLERTPQAAAALEAAGWNVLRRSQQPPSPLSPRPPLPSPHAWGEGRGSGEAGGVGRRQTALLLDTFGELAKVYAVADVAFVGGSLVRRGGQSVFQPLAQGVPVVFGPYMNNQRDIAALSIAEGVGFSVTDSTTLAAEVVRLLSLPEADREALSVRARSLIERNQGVAARCLDAVAGLLERS
ncbi:MAG: 3-deoxy-D-manno-octulosonic acid transferase [Armatimonadaceae bacterium]